MCNTKFNLRNTKVNLSNYKLNEIISVSYSYKSPSGAPYAGQQNIGYGPQRQTCHPPQLRNQKTNHNPTHVGEESGCKYNRDTLLSLVRETPLETNPGQCNTLEHFSIHTPRGHNNFKSLKTTRQKSAHFMHKHKHGRIKPDTCWGTPPRGEPVEPRSLDLRTQSSQCQEWQKERARNTKRGLRNTQTIINRQETRRENARNIEEETEEQSKVPLTSKNGVDWPDTPPPN